MDVDNQVNERIESRLRRSVTPSVKSNTVSDRSNRKESTPLRMRTRNQSNVEKVEPSNAVTRIIETRTTEIRYSERGNKSPNDSDESSGNVLAGEKKKTRSSRKSTRRTVLNGASVELDDNTAEETTVEQESEQLQSKSITEKNSVNVSGYSSDESSGKILRAYDIYKQVPEYWNVYPKTDYTYSPSSTDRKEIVPGVINMPNMSRRSLHPHTVPSLSDLRRRSPTQIHTVKREVASRYFIESKVDGHLPAKLKDWISVDSDEDEVDEKMSASSSRNISTSQLVRSFFFTRITAVVSFFAFLFSSAKDKVSQIFTRTQKQEVVVQSGSSAPQLGIWSSFWEDVREKVSYWGASVLILGDRWKPNRLYDVTDQHKFKSLATEQRKKYIWLLLLGLLPLLLLAGGGIASYARYSSDYAWEKVNNVIASWLPFSYNNIKDKIDLSQYPIVTNEAVSANDFDVGFVVQKVLSSPEFQYLLSEHKQLKVRQGNFQEELQHNLQHQNLHLKLEEQKKLQEQLLMEVERIKMQTETLFNKHEKNVPYHRSDVESGFVLWRQRMRDLSSRIKLLQETQLHLTKRMNACCNRQPSLPTVEIESYIVKFLSGIFSSEKEAEKTAPHVHHWIHSLFVAKDELEAKLFKINQQLTREVEEASNRSAEIIMTSVSEKIKEEFLKQHQESMINENLYGIVQDKVCESGEGLSYHDVQRIVDGALAKYDADKTGMVDYALESSGGSILSTRCTENYQARTAMLTILGWFHWYPSSVSPRTVIQPGVQPGKCWAFAGSEGFLVIQLSSLIQITAFSIEHIPRSLSPTGKLDSAPKDFRVLGLQHESDVFPTEIGRYQFQENGTSLQYFKVQRSDLPPYKIVELQIESNHGNMEYTCLYRFRVHGVRVTDKNLQR